jgi:hypothetical protein
MDEKQTPPPEPRLARGVMTEVVVPILVGVTSGLAGGAAGGVAGAIAAEKIRRPSDDD